MPQIHLIVGPVGSGKSTLGLRLSAEHRALRLTLDEWMARLFRPDRPPNGRGLVEWYVERARRCNDQIWSVAHDALRAGLDVVLEIGLIQRRDREDFYRVVDEAGAALTIYVVDAPREVRAQRVARRNVEQGETFSMEVPPHIFEMASDLWDPLEDDERRGRDVRVIS